MCGRVSPHLPRYQKESQDPMPERDKGSTGRGWGGGCAPRIGREGEREGWGQKRLLELRSGGRGGYAERSLGKRKARRRGREASAPCLHPSSSHCRYWGHGLLMRFCHHCWEDTFNQTPS